MTAYTDVKIITKQVVINTSTSARLIPITADEKCIDEIQRALTELEEIKSDVKRFMELDYQDDDGMDDVDAIEYTRLYIKLSKVGKEE